VTQDDLTLPTHGRFVPLVSGDVTPAITGAFGTSCLVQFCGQKLIGENDIEK
jgi:hypothetical protein